jgi:hypothetical protein
LRDSFRPARDERHFSRNIPHFISDQVFVMRDENRTAGKAFPLLQKELQFQPNGRFLLLKTNLPQG